MVGSRGFREVVVVVVAAVDRLVRVREYSDELMEDAAEDVVEEEEGS